MYIKSYKCNRFAGLINVDLEFNKGLNVILGDNESGKSTIIEGINATLFGDIRLSRAKNIHKEFIHRFMPRPAGDYIDGELSFETKDGPYILKKEWGSEENIKLISPNNSIFRDEGEIRNQLSQILEIGQASYNNIVFARQRDLKKALSNIIDDNNITNEINDLLRKTIMELDGISIDKLEQDILNEKENLYKRWDINKNYPQNNRGINSPYKTGIGKILDSFYIMENLRESMEATGKSEKDFETLSSKISEIDTIYKGLMAEKDDLEELEEHVSKRRILEIEIDSIKKDLKGLKEINKEWPRLEEAISQADGKLKKIQEKKIKLGQEKIKLDKHARKSEIGKNLATINDYEDKIEKIRAEINCIPAIEERDIDNLREAEKIIGNLETALAAGKIFGKLKKSIKPIYISKDLGDKEELNLNTDFQAKGYIRIGNEDFELEIKTGDQDFEELGKKLRGEEAYLRDLFKGLNISTVEEGLVNLKKIKKANFEIGSLTSKLELLLADISKDELELELEGLKDIEARRTMDEIEGELEAVKNDETGLIIEKTGHTEKIEKWSNDYKNLDKLFDFVVEETGKLKEKENQLSKLQPLPEAYKTSKEFSDRLKFIREELRGVEAGRDALKEKYYEAKNNLSDQSFEELKKEYLDAVTLYERNIKRGEKIRVIERKFYETKEKIAADPMEGLVEEFTSLLSAITSGKFKGSQIDGDFNLRLVNDKGEIPIDLLSAGSYDSVSLALRFAILKYLFESGGFVILDDCLVDMDPFRKKQAIEIITNFAEGYQIIFTTCNQDTAKQLGGNIIRI